MNLLFALLLFYHSVSCAVESDKEFTFVGHEQDPFYEKEAVLGIQGAFYDLMKEVCDKENLHCKFKIMPFRAAFNTVKEGEAQGFGPAAISTQRMTAFYFSDPIFRSRNAFYGLEDATKKIKTYEDLSGLKIATMSPTITSISLQRINESIGGKIIAYEELTDSIALKKADTKIYPLAYANQDVARLWISRQRSQLHEIPNLGEDLELHIALSRKSVTQTQFDAIQSRLQKLKKEGFIKKIADKYHLQAID